MIDMSINRTQSTVRSHYTWRTNDQFETMRPKRMKPRPGLHETEAETKTSYCETETETKNVVSRQRWSRDINIPEY